MTCRFETVRVKSVITHIGFVSINNISFRWVISWLIESFRFVMCVVAYECVCVFTCALYCPYLYIYCLKSIVHLRKEISFLKSSNIQRYGTG